MKRKRKATNSNCTSRNMAKSSVMSPGPSASQPDPKESAESHVKEDASLVDHNKNVEAPHQNMDDETDDHQPGPCSSPADATNPEVSSPLPLTARPPACYQEDHHDVNAGDNIVLIETDATEQVNDGLTGNICSLPIETAESDVLCPNETDMAGASITETIDISGQVNGDYQMSDISDYPIMEGRYKTGDVNGCRAGDVYETKESSQEPKLDLQEASQKVQALKETSDLPDVSNTPNIPEIAFHSDQQDSQGIKDVTRLPDCDVKLQGRDEERCQDPKSEPQVVGSPGETWTKPTDPTLLCGVESIPSHQTDVRCEDPKGLTNGLDLPDRRLLGALDKNYYDSRKSVENHISDQWTSAAHRQETPQANSSPTSLSVNASPAQDTMRPQQRTTEDASSTVQGLIMELSNINRLIMSTYRELRQKRVRHTPGRGAASGRRRREM
ncbi:hypothetical protein GDO78_019410 [Eleutherodactylus coqui]|uniref:Uncharacterized protein n=1 Tax=Eleutherodactylus coqui TaxID=57060 RepID=A0A8J6ENH7_ELECQ|nr:hypothetical protein GDO78_019410 [Eleutherodactylus coqui]